jgi:ATP-dependent DNA ligase
MQGHHHGCDGGEAGCGAAGRRGVAYEPKWDGFRCLLQRRGGAVSMTSKSGQDLARFFHEVANAAMELPESTFLLDGELVIPQGKNFSSTVFCSGSIRPDHAAKLSVETPARHLVMRSYFQRARNDIASR